MMPLIFLTFCHLAEGLLSIWRYRRSITNLQSEIDTDVPLRLKSQTGASRYEDDAHLYLKQDGRFMGTLLIYLMENWLPLVAAQLSVSDLSSISPSTVCL